MTDSNSTGGSPPDREFDRVEVRLRYRPAGDLLIGETRFDGVDDVTDEPDADTSITWVRRPDGNGAPSERYLSSFSIIGAQRRFRDQRPDFLPDSVWTTARSMFHALPVSSAGSSARFEARSEARVVVAFDDLRQVSESERSLDSDVASARALASSLRDFGSSVRLALDSYDTTDPEIGTPARRFLDGVDSFASLVAAHRRSAPSSVADVIDNLRGGLPLSETERRRLRRALERANDPQQWKTVAHELNNLAAVVRGERRLDPPEGP